MVLLVSHMMNRQLEEKKKNTKNTEKSNCSRTKEKTVLCMCLMQCVTYNVFCQMYVSLCEYYKSRSLTTPCFGFDLKMVSILSYIWSVFIKSYIYIDRWTNSVKAHLFQPKKCSRTVNNLNWNKQKKTQGENELQTNKMKRKSHSFTFNRFGYRIYIPGKKIHDVVCNYF